MREITRIDCDPEKHNFLDAIGSVSFKFSCGCSLPPNVPDDTDQITLYRNAGSPIDCPRHGEVIITRATMRLTGWKRGEPALRDFGASGREAMEAKKKKQEALAAEYAAEEAARKAKAKAAREKRKSKDAAGNPMR